MDLSPKDSLFLQSPEVASGQKNVQLSDQSAVITERYC